MRDWESCYCTREQRRTCEAIPSLLVHDTKESCTGARRTKIFVAPGHAQHAASINASLCLSVLFVPFVVRALVFYFYFISCVRRALGERGGRLLPDFLFCFHTCVIVHPVKYCSLFRVGNQ